MTASSPVPPDPIVDELMARYARVRERVAGILYVRNRLAGEAMALRTQLAQVRGDAAGASSLRAHLVQAERELVEIRERAEDAKASLGSVLRCIGAARRDRLHALAMDLATADAAENELAADSLDRRFHALGIL